MKMAWLQILQLQFGETRIVELEFGEMDPKHVTMRLFTNFVLRQNRQ